MSPAGCWDIGESAIVLWASPGVLQTCSVASVTYLSNRFAWFISHRNVAAACDCYSCALGIPAEARWPRHSPRTWATRPCLREPNPEAM
jgi:hypothetical protein